VYFGPGVYRLTSVVTVSHAGSAGSPITWIGDTTGNNTDGIGGIVRLTGSSDDQSATAGSILQTGANYRTFQGFALDTTTSALISWTAGTNLTIQDCTFQNGNSAGAAISITGGGSTSGHLIQRCMVLEHASTQCINLNGPGGVTIQNCILIGSSVGILINTTANNTVTECLFLACAVGYKTQAASTGNTVQDSIFFGCTTATTVTAGTAPTEDYNTFYGNGTNRSGISTGTHSKTYPPLFDVPRLFAGVQRNWPVWFSLSQWSQIAGIAGTGTASDDLSGMTRPATAAKISWGPHQYVNRARDTTTVFAGTASIKLADATIVTLFKPVTSAAPLNISAYVYRESSYAGTAPQMIIRQPGQADVTVTDGGSASAWNLISTTVTPATSPQWIEILLVSNNTASGANIGVYVDGISVQ